MSVSTAALSAQSLIPQFQNSFIASLALLGVGGPRVVTPQAANPACFRQLWFWRRRSTKERPPDVRRVM